MMDRRGFTIVELIVGTVVMAILGAILARMLIQDSRFVSQLEAMMDARQSARAAMNTMAVELRMVSDSGLVAASPRMLRVRTPYAWGVFCENVGADMIASLVPADSMWYASASTSGSSGVAWRNPSGIYRFDADVTVSPSTDTVACTGQGVQILPGGRLVAIDMDDSPDVGTVFYLYQTIQYEFKASSSLPGRTGLWRQAIGGVDEEILTPFDTTAGFRFFTDPNGAALATPPADLRLVTGVELRLHGESEVTPEGGSAPQDFALETRVTFLNAAN